MRSWRGLAAVALCLWSAPAMAQTALQWTVLTVPGTPALLEDQTDWLPSATYRTTLGHDLMRYLYETPVGRVPEIGRLTAALLVMKELDTRIKALGLEQPLLLRSGDRDRRNKWKSLFDLLGYSLDFPSQTAPPVIKLRTDRDAILLRKILEKAGIQTSAAAEGLARGNPVELTMP